MQQSIGRHRIALIVLAVGLLAGAVGYLLAPPRAEAHRGGRHTELHDGNTGKAANVSGGRVHTQLRHGPGGRSANVSFGRLHTVIEGGFVESFSSTFVMGSGTGDGTAQTVCNNFAALDGVVATGTGAVAVTGDADFNGTAGDVVWRGEATGQTGMVETMFGGKQTFSAQDLQVTADVGMDWIVYGFCEDFFGPAEAERMRTKAQEIMGRR